MAASQWRIPERGCYVPAVTFIDPATDKLDLDAQAKYFAYLATTGLKGIIVLGSNAETMLLTREERVAVLQTARRSVPPDFPLIAGVSGHSTAQVLEHVADAVAARADFILLLPCAYFGKQTTRPVIDGFFDEIASKSPLPVIVYNFPGVCNGVDLDSETITGIAERNPSVVGVKLTCGSVGKAARLAAALPGDRFATLGGQSDFLLGAMAVGAAGCIAAFANVAPRSVARLHRLCEAGEAAKALHLQHELALAEAPTKAAGVASTKYAAALSTAKRAGILDAERLLRPRKPYVEISAEAKAKISAVMDRIAALEDEED